MIPMMRWWAVTLVVSVAFGARLFAADPALELVVQTGHREDLEAGALSEDGKLVLTGSKDKMAILWDGATGTQLRTFRGHSREVSGVALSRDGKLVLTGSLDHTAVLWDAVTGIKLQTFQGDDVIDAVALSNDGKRVLTGSGDATAVLWDVATGDKVRTFRGHTRSVLAVALSEDGKRVVTGSWDKTAILWDAATGEKLQTFPGHPGTGDSVALSADGQRVLISSKDSVVLWDGASGAKLQTFPGSRAALSSDGKRALTSSRETVILWDAATGDKLKTFSGHNGSIWAVALSRNGKRVLTGSWYQAILWDAATGDKLQTFHGRSGRVVAAALSRDGQRLLTASHRTAMLWDPVRGEKVRTLQVPIYPFTTAALSGDGKRVLTGSLSDPILWDADSGKQLRELKGDTNKIEAVALSADGKRALTSSLYGKVILWDADSGKKLQTSSQQSFAAVVLSPDGKRVFSGHDGVGVASLWDADSGNRLQTFKGLKGVVFAVALSADGKRAITGSSDNTAILWDAATGAKLQTFLRHTRYVTAVALSDDGRRALTGAEDGTLFLWDADKAEPLRTLRGHTDKITAAVFGSDGKRAITASDDGTARFWDLATGEELCRLISIDEGQEWLVATPDGLFDGSVNAPSFVSFRIAGTLDFVPLDRYLHRYCTPGLLARITKGERPKAKVDIARALPPKVRIVVPAASLEIKDGSLVIKGEAESRGEFPVTALHLMLDGRHFPGQNAVIKIAEPRLGKAEAAWKVTLDPGPHIIKVLADTALAKGVSSQEVEVRYVGGAAQVELPRLFVLAIGISHYDDRTLNLDFAADDAAAVAAAYKAHCSKLFRAIETRVEQDDKANRRGLVQGLSWLRDNVKSGDYSVFFFAGHGEKDKNGALYFLPADVDVKDLAGTAVSADDLKRLLGGIPGRLTAVLDACHSGDFDAGKPRGPHGLTDDLLRDLVAEESGLVVICATTGNESAQEIRMLKHGAFTVALLEGLSGKADADGDGIVYLHELDGYLYKRVGELTKREQHTVLGKPTSIRSFPVSKP